jgi:hypothetical protein
MLATDAKIFASMFERVFSQKFKAGGALPVAKCNLPARMLSFIGTALLGTAQVTWVFIRPIFSRCFSTSLSCLMIMNGR